MQSQAYIELSKENNKGDPQFKIGGHVKIQKYNKTFEKGYTTNWRKIDFVNKKVKNTVL